MGGQGDDRSIDPQFTQTLRCQVAVQHGHLHVHQDEIKAVLRLPIDGFLAVAGFDDRQACLPEQQADQPPVRVTIVDDQDATTQLNRVQTIPVLMEAQAVGLRRTVDQ